MAVCYSFFSVFSMLFIATIWGGTPYASGFVAGFFYILTAILGLCCARFSVRGPSSWLKTTAMTANIFLFIMMILGCVITIFVLLTAGHEIRSPVLLLLGIFQTACLIPVCIAAAIMCTKIRSSALNYSSQIYMNRPPPAHANSVRIPAYTYSSVRPFEF